MRILQIINNIAWGGAGNLLINYIPIMKNSGHDIDLLTLKQIDKYHLDNFKKIGIKIITLSENSLYNPLYIFKIKQFIKKGNYDIVHVHLFPALYYVGLAAYFGIKSKLVFTEHNTWNTRMSNPVLRIIDKFIYRKYKMVICITDKVKLNMQNHLKGLNILYPVVYNGINVSKFSNAIVSHLYKKDLYQSYSVENIILIMVGRFVIQKDQKTLIEAIFLLPQNFHLLLIGDGPTKPECEKLTNELQLNDRIRFMGIRKDIPDILKLCDIGILSSNWEGFPITALEYMASNKPVIVSDVPGLSDTVGDVALLFEKGNSEQLANKIVELIDNKEYYNAVAKKCYEKAQEYDIKKMTEKYLELYQDLLKEKK